MSADREAGTNWTDITAQARQLASWMRNAKFDGDPDRAVSHLMRNPDKWIDPTLSASANYQQLKRDFGLRTQGDREERLHAAEGEERDRARRAIRENIERIETGEASELVQDIREEFGAAFVEEAIDAARTPDELGGAPEANDHNPSAVAEANGVPGAAAASVEVTHEAETTEQTSLAGLERAPRATPDRTVTLPNGRITGLLRRLPEPVRSLALGALTVGPDAPLKRIQPS